MLPRSPQRNAAVFTGQHLKAIPPQASKRRKLRSLNLLHNHIEELADDAFSTFRCLEVLILSRNRISVLPPSLFDMRTLVELHLNDNALVHLPASIGELVCLEKLWLYNNKIKELPSEIGSLEQVKVLSLKNNAITRLPEELALLSNLQALYLGGNPLPPEVMSKYRPFNPRKSLKSNVHNVRLFQKFVSNDVYEVDTTVGGDSGGSPPPRKAATTRPQTAVGRRSDAAPARTADEDIDITMDDREKVQEEVEHTQPGAPPLKADTPDQSRPSPPASNDIERADLYSQYSYDDDDLPEGIMDTDFFTVCGEGNVEWADIMVRSMGISADEQDDHPDYPGWTGLHHAAINGKVDMCIYLIDELGADPSLADADGQTAADKATDGATSTELFKRRNKNKKPEA